ncbi:uncharacterized protein LOC135394401 [Ornithodoros turicata]|uniref:Putative transporter n=1 Tax=Ornithodoros turicata TaxID=34597 RepID=A0A2R5LAR2_9ACAR
MGVSVKVRKLLPLVSVTSFFLSAVAALVPFLTLQLRSLGLSDEEVVIIHTAAAFCSSLGPVILGLLAEKWSKYRGALFVSIFFAGIGYVALLVIPKIVRVPRTPLVEFDCPSGLYLERCPDWDSCSGSRLNPKGIATFRLANCQYNCPQDGAHNTSAIQPIHFCFQSHEGNVCVFHEAGSKENSTVEFRASFLAATARTLYGVKANEFREYAGRKGADQDAVIDVCSFDLLAPILVNQKQFSDYICRPHPENCFIRCSVTIADALGRQMHSAPCVGVQADPRLTFWAALGVRLFADFWAISAFYLLEAVTILSINDFNGLYGKIKLWAAFGMTLFSAIAGLLVDYYSSIAGTTDYSPAVLLFAGLALIACALILSLPSMDEKKLNLTNSYAYTLTPEPRFCSLDMTFLVILVLLLGCIWGYLEMYLHWIYVDMGGNNLLIGLSIAIPMGCSAPFIAIAKSLVRNIGRANLLVFAFMFYATRTAGLSYVTARWWTMPFEAMEAFTLPVLWVALVSYGQKLVSTRQRLTIQCLLIVLHFCIGRGAGSISGYFLNDAFGYRATFRGIAVVSASAGILYLFLYHTCIRRMRRRASRKRASMPATINGGWYPMQNSRANGDTPAHRPMMRDQDDSDTGGFEDGVSGRNSWNKRDYHAMK